MNYETYIQDAIEMVSAWELPEEEFSQAVQQQAELMAGISFDQLDTSQSINVYIALRF